MSAADDINALVVAARVLKRPSRLRVTDLEVTAMAGCLIGLNEQLDDLEARPTTNASLAASIASFIQTEDAMTAAKGADGYVPLTIAAARYDAFNALRTTFETEFPL